MYFLSYKTFVWPQNPHTYREVASRTPEYYTQDGETYFKGMGDLRPYGYSGRGRSPEAP